MDYCTENHDHSLYKCIPLPDQRSCPKHGVRNPCPHCAEDEKVLEERIEAVVGCVQAYAVALDRMRDGWTVDLLAAGDSLRDALRSLVREIRR